LELKNPELDLEPESSLNTSSGLVKGLMGLAYGQIYLEQDSCVCHDLKRHQLKRGEELLLQLKVLLAHLELSLVVRQLVEEVVADVLELVDSSLGLLF
jgi:hypothetical protein